MAAATKVSAELLAWTTLAVNTSTLTSEGSLVSTLKAGIMISIAHVDGNANANGVLVLVQQKAEDSPNPWKDIYSLRLGAGTADADDLDGSVSEAGGTIVLTDATDFDARGEKIFIVDGTIANSEMVRGNGTAVETITLLDSLTNAHADASVVTTDPVEKYLALPDELRTFRVALINDDADAVMAARIDLETMTAIG